MNFTLPNVTEALSRPGFDSTQHQDYLTIRRNLQLIAVPVVVLVGLVGNLISTIIITRDGLRKSSNILLVAIAMADTSLLLGKMFTALQVGLLPNSTFFTFGKTLNYVFFACILIFRIFLSNVAMCCSYIFPLFVTLERVCAVYFPLKFQLLITPARTLAAVLLTVAFFTPFAIFRSLSYRLSPETVFQGKKIMVFTLSTFYFRFEGVLDVMDQVTNNVTGSAPIALLILGSVAISYKVKVAAIRRARMMSQGDPEKDKKLMSQSRTTRTLLAVCVTFISLAGAVLLHDLVVPRIKPPVHVVQLLWVVKDLVMCLNGSSNFFVYVFSNNKFRERLLVMFAGKTPNPSILRKESHKI